MSDITTQLQVSTTINFSSIMIDKTIVNIDNFIPLTDSDFPIETIPYDTPLYIRAKHTDPEMTNGVSQWSSINEFTIAQPWRTIVPDTPMIASIIGTITIKTAHGYHLNIVALTPTKAVIKYINEDEGNQYVRVVTISNTTISIGNATIMLSESYDPWYTWMDKISETSIIVFGRMFNTGKDTKSYVLLLSISGTNIAVTAPVINQTGYHSYYNTIIALTPSMAIACAKYNTSNTANTGTVNTYAHIVNISGTTLTLRAPVLCNPHYSYFISAAKINNNKIIMCYRNHDDNKYLYAQVLSISGNTITPGPATKCSSHIASHTATVVLDNGTALVCYGNYSDNKYLYAQLLNVNENNSISLGTPIRCNTHNTIVETETNPNGHNQFHSLTLTLVSRNQAVVCYRNNTDNGYLYSQVVMVTNNIITTTTPKKCNSFASDMVAATKLDKSSILLAYRSNTSENKVCLQILRD